MTETPAEHNPLPTAPEAEAAILGVILLESKLLNDIATRLRVEDFYYGQNKAVYATMLDLHRTDTPVDLITLTDRLKKTGKLEAAGGDAYVVELLESQPTTANYAYHAQLIRSAATKREIIKAAAGLQARARGPAEMRELREQILAMADGLNLSGIERPEPIDVEAILADIKRAPEALNTGYPALDRFIEINPAELIVLASRPQHGKTTLALNLCLNMLEQYPGRPFVFFSHEMTLEQVLAKMIGALTCQQYRTIKEQIRSEQLKPETLKALAALEKYGEERRLYIVNRPRWGVERILDYCQGVKGDQGQIGAVFVDYIGLVARLEPGDQVEQKYARVAAYLRIAAQELNCPVLAISQISREADKGKTEKQRYPRLDQMRYSGAVEQEATTVLGLFNQEVDNRRDIDEAQGAEGYGEVEKEAQLHLLTLKSRYGSGNKPLSLVLKNGNRIEEIRGPGGRMVRA